MSNASFVFSVFEGVSQPASGLDRAFEVGLPFLTFVSALFRDGQSQVTPELSSRLDSVSSASLTT